MLFKWEIEALWGDSNRSNWTLSPYGIFFIIFFETFYMVTLMKNSIWEIRNALADINSSLLESGITLPQQVCEKFINEALSSFQFKRFLALKKGNGFKNVWHSCGQFLARWREQGAVHVFSSVEDLSIILKAYRPPVDEQRLARDSNPPLTFAPPQTSSAPSTMGAQWLRRPPVADKGSKTARGIRACFINATSLKKTHRRV